MAGEQIMKAKYQEILRENGVLDELAIVIIKDPKYKDQGMGSDRQAITLTFKNTLKSDLHLFVKGLRTDSSQTKFAKEEKSFEKEATFFTKYLPAAMEFCELNGSGKKMVSELYPKCYHGDRKLIVLENLVIDQGYTVLGRDNKHDWETAMSALTNLAKHHAISYAMIHEAGGPELFFERFRGLDYEAYEQPAFRALLEPWLKAAISADIAILQKSQVDGASEAASKLAEFLPLKMSDLFGDSLKCEDNDLRTLGHGDYWYANMMFKKDPKTGKITHHKSVDFQVTRYNSPVIDVTFYLFTSVNTDIRQRRLKDLLHLYLVILNTVSKNLGHGTNLCYKELFAQYRKRFRIGFFQALIVSYGPGMEIFKDVDLVNLSAKEVAEIAQKLALKWINENEQLVEYVATKIVKVVKEYCELEAFN